MISFMLFHLFIFTNFISALNYNKSHCVAALILWRPLCLLHLIYMFWKTILGFYSFSHYRVPSFEKLYANRIILIKYSVENSIIISATHVQLSVSE